MTKTASIYKSGQLYQIPPGTLVLERNIRDAQPDPELLGSVKALGVLQPVTAVIGQDGRLVVRLGHRRTLAALAAKRQTIPVYVVDVDDRSDQGEVTRIITQHDENTLRTGLTAGDELGVVEQLAAFGLSVDEISEQARISKDRVTTAMTVSGSKLAAKATEKYEALTLDQAAVVAEFDTDDEVAKKLIVTAVQEPGRFAHAAQRARDDRAHAIARAAATKELEDAGVKVVQEPGYGSKTKAERLDNLVDAEGKVLTLANHKACPGHVAWFNTWENTPKYGCASPAKNGHKDRYGSSSRTATADLSDAEREAAKKARRLVIDNNKAWDSAEVVRRVWLKEFAQRKTAPKGAAAFIVSALSYDRYILTHEGTQTGREELCTEWGLPMKPRGYHKVVDIPASTSEARALMIALVQILAAHESSTDRMDWRRDGKTERHGRYLAFLESAGYGLSDVEKFAISSKTVR